MFDIYQPFRINIQFVESEFVAEKQIQGSAVGCMLHITRDERERRRRALARARPPRCAGSAERVLVSPKRTIRFAYAHTYFRLVPCKLKAGAPLVGRGRHGTTRTFDIRDEKLYLTHAYSHGQDDEAQNSRKQIREEVSEGTDEYYNIEYWNRIIFNLQMLKIFEQLVLAAQKFYEYLRYNSKACAEHAAAVLNHNNVTALTAHVTAAGGRRTQTLSECNSIRHRCRRELADSLNETRDVARLGGLGPQRSRGPGPRAPRRRAARRKQ
ncbi:hypothetical protein EVAR_16075_1 [Eumeta japonica]|uniref:Uncharacterized protein n=1 Tax=Eumeta variegata TaxID=151549 RepID=A0A4C1UK03_EUMVA|nr:hypothetical protein EVAR_16075_1 [Eumeta japonica]